jgi:hypothetical protein
MTNDYPVIPLITDNKLVGVANSSTHAFVVATLQGSLDSLPANSYLQRPEYWHSLKGCIPQFADAEAFAGLTIVSEEVVELFERYGIPLTVDLSPDVFAYESGLRSPEYTEYEFPGQEVEYAPLRQFRFGRIEERLQLGHDFNVLLDAWCDANLRHVNPLLGLAEMYLMYRLYTDFVEKFSRQLEKSGEWSEDLYTARRYALSPTEKGTPEILSSAYNYEGMMEKFGYHHVW